MRSIIRRAAAAVALLTLPALLTVAGQADAAPGRPSPAPVVHEEDAGWNCRTMDNHQCGKAAGRAVTACTRPTAMVGRSTRRHAIRLTHVPASLMPACLKLGQRPARQTAETYTPGGPALVIECRMQGLDRTELGFCLRQP